MPYAEYPDLPRSTVLDVAEHEKSSELPSDLTLPARRFYAAVQALSYVPIEGHNVPSKNPRAYHRNLVMSYGVFPGTTAGAGLDLGRLGYQMPTRWNKLLNDYLPADFYQVKPKGQLSPMNESAHYFGRREMSHTHGPCLLTFAYGRHKNRLRVTVTSRTAYFVPVGVLDYTMAHLMAQSIVSRYSFLHDYDLTWMFNQVQWRVWTAIPWLESTGVHELLDPESWIAERYRWAKENWENPKYMVESRYKLFRNWTGPRYRAAFSNPTFIPISLTQYHRDRKTGQVLPSVLPRPEHELPWLEYLQLQREELAQMDMEPDTAADSAAEACEYCYQ